jgi:hypothetical protein
MQILNNKEYIKIMWRILLGLFKVMFSQKTWVRFITFETIGKVKEYKVRQHI